MQLINKEGISIICSMQGGGGGGLGGHLNSCHSRVEHAKEHDAFVNRDTKSGKLEGEGEVVW